MQKTLLNEQIEHFYHHLCLLERSPATVKKYGHALRLFYDWLPDEKGVDKETVIAFKGYLATDQAPSGVNVALAALNGLFRYLGWEDCCVRALRIQRRVFATKEKELTRAEYERLVSAAESRKDFRLSLLLQLMASTGIRVSEIHAITLETAQEGKAVIALKGKVRTILLPGKLCRKLIKYAHQRHIVSGELFLTRSGRPMNRKEIWAQMKRLCRFAKVEPGKVFPHNLRHLFARVFYSAQRDIAKLADLLGHSCIETTRIYLRSSGEEHLQVLDRLKLTR